MLFSLEFGTWAARRKVSACSRAWYLKRSKGSSNDEESTLCLRHGAKMSYPQVSSACNGPTSAQLDGLLSLCKEMLRETQSKLWDCWKWASLQACTESAIFVRPFNSPLRFDKNNFRVHLRCRYVPTCWRYWKTWLPPPTMIAPRMCNMAPTWSKRNDRKWVLVPLTFERPIILKPGPRSWVILWQCKMNEYSSFWEVPLKVFSIIHNWFGTSHEALVFWVLHLHSESKAKGIQRSTSDWWPTA